jgi:hypothetical protein
VRQSKVQRSSPSGPGNTSIAFIRAVHLGQRGRWIGSNSA